jgi:hypothetical protein
LLFAEDDADEVDCASLDASYNAAEQDLGAANGNESVALTTASFPDWGERDLHLSVAAFALVDDIAQWQSGDPLVDIDGEPRVAEDGAMEHAGADIP